MLDRMISPQFDWWRALWHIEPWGDEAKQTATLAAEMHNAVLLGLAHTGRVKIEQSDLKTFDEFMPKFTFVKPGAKKKKKRKTMTPAQRVSPKVAEAWMAARWGNG